MAYTEDELHRMLQRAHSMPYGTAQIALVEQVVAHADADSHEELAFVARMSATTAYTFGGEPAKAFVTFSRCLAEFDNTPRDYHDGWSAELLWQFKWMVNALTKFPEVPLERTTAVLDDMERRYRAGGHSLHAVWAYRHELASHIGDADAARQWYEQWCAAPRDDLSDCVGCDPSAKVAYLVSLGRDEEAVALAEPVLTGQLTCVEQPQSMLTNLLYPYLRTGRTDAAVDAHRRGYRAMRGNVADLSGVAHHVEFCGRTGNEARGLELVVRHLDWLDRAPSPFAAMKFAAAAALVLRRLAEAGQGALTVHRPAYRGTDRDRPAGEVPVAALGAELTASAVALAERFDARNGTTHQSQRVAATLAAAPLVEHLPLSPTARRRPSGAAATGPVAAAGAAAAPAGTSPARPGAGRPTPAGPPGVAVPEGATAEELLDLVEQCLRDEDRVAAEEVLRVFDQRYPEPELAGVVRARRVDGRGWQQVDSGDLPAAETAWREAVRLFDDGGHELRAQVTRGRLGQVLCALGREDDGLPMVEDSLAYLRKHGDAERCTGALLRASAALLMLGRAEPALAMIDEAARYAEESGSPRLPARVAMQRAYCLAELGGPAEELAGAAAQARQAYRPFGGYGYAEACLFQVGLIAEPAEALRVVDEAVAAAGRDRIIIGARTARARVLSALGRPEETIDELIEVVAYCTERDLTSDAGYARIELAHAYLHEGRALEAAEAGEEALAALQARDPEPVADTDRCRKLLVAAYRELGEAEAALELLDRLLAHQEGFDLAAARGQTHEEAGDLLYRLDRDAEAAARFRAAAAEYATAGLPADEVRAWRRTMQARHYAGDQDTALDALSELDSRVAALAGTEPEHVWETAMAGYDAARMLSNLDRLVEAEGRVEPVAGKLRTIEAFHEALLAELLRGEVLLRLGRAEAAEPALREVVGALPRDDDALPRAAWLLAEALEATGRSGEAAEVRREYGVDDDD